jgi:hypothetical protein
MEVSILDPLLRSKHSYSNLSFSSAIVAIKPERENDSSDTSVRTEAVSSPYLLREGYMSRLMLRDS